MQPYHARTPEAQTPHAPALLPLTARLPPRVSLHAGAPQYYSGANNSIQHAGVQYIIHSVVTELAANPNRTFTYIEQVRVL